MQHKPFKTFAEQKVILESRGLIIEKQEFLLLEKLENIGYYRLSDYLHPFRQNMGKLPTEGQRWRFRKGVRFETVWRYYLLDRRLRGVIMDAIERIEIALRVAVAYQWAQSMPSCNNPQKFVGSEKTLHTIQDSYDRSKEDCAMHYKSMGIISVKELPIWVMVQFASFGSLCRLFQYDLPDDIKERIALQWNCPNVNFFYSLFALFNEARNVSAHQGRIWNRRWTRTTKKQKGETKRVPIAKAHRDFSWEKVEPHSTAFLLLALGRILRRVAPNSQWEQRVASLLTCNLPVKSIVNEMGFPTRAMDMYWCIESKL